MKLELCYATESEYGLKIENGSFAMITLVDSKTLKDILLIDILKRISKKDRPKLSFHEVPRIILSFDEKGIPYIKWTEYNVIKKEYNPYSLPLEKLNIKMKLMGSNLIFDSINPSDNQIHQG